MNRIVSVILILTLTISACNQTSAGPTVTSTALQPTVVTQNTSAVSTAVFTPFSSAPISENAYYVSTIGNDANPGTKDLPWRTIEKAANELAAGQEVYIRSGVYKEQVRFDNSGTKSSPITILAYPNEVPIIDGSNYQLPSSEWSALLTLAGNYIEVYGLEVRYSNWMGVVLTGNHNRASNMNVHHNRENGILVTGSYGIVEKSYVWQNANRNEINLPNESKSWASGLSAARHPENVILRGNVVYENWGEGLSSYEASGTTIEDNIVHDNWSANIYISDANKILLQRNLVYLSPNNIMKGGSQVGIMMGDEKYTPPSSNIVIINNLVSNTHLLLYWWQGIQGGGMNNVLIAHNTFVNSQSIDTEFGAITFGSGGIHHNVRFENNIIMQSDNQKIGADYGKGIVFASNLWSSAPPSNMSSTSDVIGNPRLLCIGDYTSPKCFDLSPMSPAIDHALALRQVVDDYLGGKRDSMPDIGAFEH